MASHLGTHRGDGRAQLWQPAPPHAEHPPARPQPGPGGGRCQCAGPGPGPCTGRPPSVPPSPVCVRVAPTHRWQDAGAAASGSLSAPTSEQPSAAPHICVVGVGWGLRAAIPALQSCPDRGLGSGHPSRSGRSPRAGDSCALREWTEWEAQAALSRNGDDCVGAPPAVTAVPHFRQPSAGSAGCWSPLSRRWGLRLPSRGPGLSQGSGWAACFSSEETSSNANSQRPGAPVPTLGPHTLAASEQRTLSVLPDRP